MQTLKDNFDALKKEKESLLKSNAPKNLMTMTDEHLKLLISAIPTITGLAAVILSITTILITKSNFDKQLKQQRENLDRQMEIQLATTFEKEWIENVRQILARIAKLADKFMDIEDDMMQEVELMKLYTDTINENFLLTLYLNPKRPYEKKLLDVLDELGDAVEPSKFRDYDKVESILDKLLEAAHELFDSRIPQVKAANAHGFLMSANENAMQPTK